MKSYLSLLIFLFVSFASFAQKRTIETSPFSRLSLGVPANVYLQQGSTERVEVECDDDLFEELDFVFSGGKLTIKKEGRWSWGSSFNRSDLTIYITMKEVEGVELSGSGRIYGESVLRGNDMKFRVSGSGSADLEIEGDEIEMTISGSGSIELKGNAEEAEVKISGSGQVKAERLEVKVLEASISGSGSCHINATEEIDANISGSGSVFYYGNPDRVIANSSGSGKVRKRS